jgi:hypothetical protein
VYQEYTSDRTSYHIYHTRKWRHPHAAEDGNAWCSVFP